MNKINELSKAQKNEEKLLIAKVIDKVKFCNEKNKFQNTSFLDLAQQITVERTLELKKIKSYELFGGHIESERKMLILYPQQHLDNIENLEDYKKSIYNEIMSVIRISLPKEQFDMYEHRTYLGALIKLGIKREKIGDISVKNNGADIIISKEIESYIQNSIKNLTRFQKASIEIVPIEKFEYMKIKKEIFNISVTSMRLDCIVAELARCSRKDANKIIEQERVFVNFKEELISSKKIQPNTYITIRGKGRFKIREINGETRSGRLTLEVEK